MNKLVDIKGKKVSVIEVDYTSTLVDEIMSGYKVSESKAEVVVDEIFNHAETVDVKQNGKETFKSNLVGDLTYNYKIEDSKVFEDKSFLITGICK